MNIRRLLSYIIVAGIAAVLWTTWVKEHPQKSAASESVATTTSSVSREATPQHSSFYAPPKSGTRMAPPVKPKAAKSMALKASAGHTVEVKTDVLDVLIDLNGGSVITSKLPQYTVSIKDKTPITLLSAEPNKLYLAQSGLQNAQGEVASIKFRAQKAQYIFDDGQSSHTVYLTGKTASGLKVTKRYTFSKGSYAIKMAYTIKNTAGKVWQGRLFTQLVRKKTAEF